MGTSAPPAGTAPATPPGQPPAGAPPSGTPDNAGAPPAAPVVPEKYDLKLADKSPLDLPFVERFSGIAKELKLPQEHASKAFAFVEKEIGDRLAAQLASEQKGGDGYERRVADWSAQAQNDKEIGGLQWKTNLALAQRTAAAFFEKDLNDWLEQSGFGSHPMILRALVKIGKAMGEDKLVQATGTGEPTRKKTQSELMYPEHYQGAQT